MCVNISNQSVANYDVIDLSATAYLINLITEFRNDQDSSEVIKVGKKVIGALCFAGLLIAAALEHLMRMVFAALAALPAALCFSDGASWAGRMAGMSWVFLGDHVARCVVAQVKNIAESKFSFEDLAPCPIFAL